jgi:hypothetical protein
MGGTPFSFAFDFAHTIISFPISSLLLQDYLLGIDPRRFDPNRIHVHEEGDPDCYRPEYRALVDIALNYDSDATQLASDKGSAIRNMNPRNRKWDSIGQMDSTVCLLTLHRTALSLSWHQRISGRTTARPRKQKKRGCVGRVAVKRLDRPKPPGAWILGTPYQTKLTFWPIS